MKNKVEKNKSNGLICDFGLPLLGSIAILTASPVMTSDIHL